MTLDIPEPTIRLAESLAAAKGIPLTQYFAEALEEKVRQSVPPAVREVPRWMQGFGALADLKQENTRIAELIEQEFERIDPEDR